MEKYSVNSMTIEKKKRSDTSKEELRRGILNLGGGIATIVAGVATFGNILQDHEYSSNRHTTDYFKNTYHTTNPQNIELIKTGENAFDLLLDYGIPIIFIGAGIGAGIYGIKTLGDAKKSKYDNGRIDYNSEEYKKWQPRK